MKTYSFAYGSGTVELPLDEKNVIGELHGNAVAPLADIRAALWASLDAPIDSAPLCERARAGDTVALVVSDMTRFWMRQDLVVPHLVDYLTERCGVREEDITIVIANGTHIGGDEQELRTLVTDAVYDRVKVKNHDCEAKDLVYLGTTPHGTPVSIDRTAAEADLVVCLGAVTHHVMAGFGGGRKSILPGISGRETIFHNHAFSLDAAQLLFTLRRAGALLLLLRLGRGGLRRLRDGPLPRTVFAELGEAAAEVGYLPVFKAPYTRGELFDKVAVVAHEEQRLAVG